MFPINKLSLFLFLLSHCASSQHSPSFPGSNHESPGNFQSNLPWMENCIKTKGREAVDDVLKKWDDGQKCFWKVTYSFPQGSRPGDLTGVPEAACKSKAALQKCLEPTAAAVQKCLSEKGKLDVEVQKTAVIEGFNYLCAKDGNRLKGLLEYRVSMRPDEIEFIIDKCKLPKFVNTMIDYQEQKTIFNQTVCRFHEEVKLCIVQTVKNTSSTLAPVVEELLDVMKSPCNNAGNAIFQFSSWIMISTLLLIMRELIFCP